MKASIAIAPTVLSLALVASLVAPACAAEPSSSVQVHFSGPAGMRVHWQVSREGKFCSKPLVAPANLEFRPGAIYRLKLTHIPVHEGTTLYPSLEIAPITPRSAAFVAHSKIPVDITEKELAQVLSGRFVRRVIHLPNTDDGGFERRGTILAILRMGNRDLEPSRPPEPDKKPKK